MPTAIDRLEALHEQHETVCSQLAESMERIAELEAAQASYVRQIGDLKRALADIAKKAHAFESGLSDDCDGPERDALRQAAHVLIGP